MRTCFEQFEAKATQPNPTQPARMYEAAEVTMRPCVVEFNIEQKSNSCPPNNPGALCLYRVM